MLVRHAVRETLRFSLAFLILLYTSCSKKTPEPAPPDNPQTPDTVVTEPSIDDIPDNGVDTLGSWQVFSHWDADQLHNYSTIQFPAADTGLITDEVSFPTAGAIRTTDAGKHWSKRYSLATNNQLVTMVNGSVGVGYREDDVGSLVDLIQFKSASTSWIELLGGVVFGIPNSKVNTEDVKFPAKTIGFVLFDGGNVWKIYNPLTSVTAAAATGTSDKAKAIYFLDGKQGWSVSADGQIMATTDSANTWTLQLSAGENIDFRKVFFKDAQNGWATTSANYIYRTTNGGTSWVKIKIPGPNLFKAKDIVFVTSQRGFTLTGREILETTDGGQTWKRSCKMGKETIKSLCYDGVGTIWALSGGSEVRTVPLEGGGTETGTWGFDSVLKLPL